MKKFLIIVASLLVMIGINSCQCSNKNVEPVLNDAVETVDSLYVEHVTALDKQAMFTNHGANYKWFETGVVLNNWLDTENDGSIEMVVNIFQVIEDYGDNSFDTFVFKLQHVDGETFEDSVHGFWVEDMPLNDEEIKVSFAKAFELVNQVNLPKPHTRQVVLRKQVGPLDANAQWIFGNQTSQIYVDAVTGEVRDYNPAFGQDFGYAFTW